MTNVKMHYDGWVQLPVGLRRKLALETNVQLEAVLTEDGILLRPARAKPARTSATEPEAPPKVPAQVQKPTRKPRAPTTAAATSRGLILPEGLKPRGRRRATPAQP